MIADTRNAIRILETSQPPAFYIPRDDVNLETLTRSPARSFCEWKGAASYFDLNPELTNGELQLTQVGWTYTHPNSSFASITNHLAFYAQQLTCSVDGEEVDPNGGTFYGGWITSKVVGPFKGGPGSSWW